MIKYATILLLAISLRSFSQDSTGIVLPRSAFNVTSKFIAEPYPVLKEDGILYKEGVGDVHADITCNATKRTAEIYADVIDFKNTQQATYENERKKRSLCCFKLPDYQDGKLSSWIETVKKENDTTTYYKIFLSWEGIIGTCYALLDVNLENKNMASVEAIANSLLIDMIAKTKRNFKE
jgi:hypothetical protein